MPFINTSLLFVNKILMQQEKKRFQLTLVNSLVKKVFLCLFLAES